MKNTQYGPVIVLSTAPDRTVAETIAAGLIDRRLAACVQLVPGLTSFYRWEGKVNQDSEVQLIIKTRSSNLAATKDFVTANHPYDVPEFVVIDIAGGSSEYLEWLKNECEPSGE